MSPLPRLAAGFPQSVRRRSLVRRLVVLAAAWSIAVLIVAGFSLSAFFERSGVSRFDEQLSDTVDGLFAGAQVEDGRILGPAFGDPKALRAYSGDYWEIAQVDGSELHAVARSRSLWDRVLAPPPLGVAVFSANPGKAVFYDAPGPLNQKLRVAALQGRLPEVAAPVIFMAAEDRSPLDRDIAGFDTTVAVTLLLLGVGLIAAVIVQVRVGLQPLFALQREIAQVRTGRTERVTGLYPAELSPLAGELNALMAHNQEVVERQRTHVGNLAHALKTPLSVMLSEASGQTSRLAEVVNRQAKTMTEQVDHHLRRARAAARAGGPGERTAVAEVIDELARTLERIFRERGVTIDWDCDEALAFAGERQDLMEVVGNLAENACKWCRSKVRITAAAAEDRRLRLAVEDDGLGLAPDKRVEVLRRGARLDESAPGSGLGLSIVDELSRAYGGSLALSDSPLGGLRIEVMLPRVDETAPSRPTRGWIRSTAS